MAKRKTTKKVKKSTRARKKTDGGAITTDKMLGFLTVSYVLDAAGLLDPRRKAKLDSLSFPGVPSWDESVEGEFGINRTFVRSVYSLCTEVNSSIAAIVFILRGLDCPDYEARLVEVLGPTAINEH